MIQLKVLTLYIIVFFFITSNEALSRRKRALSQIYTKTWTNATIPYFINPSFSDADIFYLKRAMDLYANETCIRFESYKPDIHPNWLKIEDAEICHSEIGMQNSGQQALSLSKSCRNYGLILHELAHTIGLMHEMMRPDRNQFIRVFTENMQDDASQGFAIESTHFKLLGTPFDFQSITMYSPYDFSKNGLPVWTKMNSSDPTPIFDSREKDISFWDIKAINEIYQCSNHCSSNLCTYPSFMNKNCTCQSPEDFAKRRCIDDPNYLSICKNASSTDVCYDKPVVASEICRQTCGRCFRYGDHGFSTPPLPVCLDHNIKRCKQNKLDGYCYTDTWTKVNCKKSCKRCTVHPDPSVIEFTCKDRHNADLCEEWASSGQCDVNPGFMKSNCALSCGSCVANGSSTKPKDPCRNYSPDSYCDVMAKENKCDGTTLKICLGSCGKCGPDYERNEANISESEIERVHKIQIKKECKDILSDCEYFSRAGHCATHKESMKYHCNKSCNFCDDEDCSNIDSDHVCDDVKQRGLCKLHAGFASRCKKTCQQCKSVMKTVATEAPCADKESKYICSEIVRRNQCRDDVSRTHRCLQSCGLCNSTYATVTLPQTKSIITPSTTKPCVDEDNVQICERLRSNGWCQSYLDRAVLCRKTCNLCDIAVTKTMCQNLESSATCKSWASAGYCVDNREHMIAKCALACKFCTSTEESTVPCTDLDDKSTCDVYVKDNYCHSNIEYMKERCKNSCGFCGNSDSTPSRSRTMTSTISSTVESSPMIRICTNIESNKTCQTWADRGFCIDYADYMIQNCASTCKVCVPLSTTASTKKPCTNSQTGATCNSWKDGGYCSLDHIAAVCKKTCNICE